MVLQNAHEKWNKQVKLEVNLVAQLIKISFVIAASHTETPVQGSVAPLPIQLLTNVPGKKANDGYQYWGSCSTCVSPG